MKDIDLNISLIGNKRQYRVKEDFLYYPEYIFNKISHDNLLIGVSIYGVQEFNINTLIDQALFASKQNMHKINLYDFSSIRAKLISRSLISYLYSKMGNIDINLLNSASTPNVSYITYKDDYQIKTELISNNQFDSLKRNIALRQLKL
jgi:hypothetical protein